MSSRRIVLTTQAYISRVVAQGGAKRVGYTCDVFRRAKEYNRIGLKGTIFVAATTNGRKSENRLLNMQFECNPDNENKHKKSNIINGKTGYIYCIA